MTCKSLCKTLTSGILSCFIFDAETLWDCDAKVFSLTTGIFCPPDSKPFCNVDSPMSLMCVTSAQIFRWSFLSRRYVDQFCVLCCKWVCKSVMHCLQGMSNKVVFFHCLWKPSFNAKFPYQNSYEAFLWSILTWQQRLVLYKAIFSELSCSEWFLTNLVYALGLHCKSVQGSYHGKLHYVYHLLF